MRLIDAAKVIRSKNAGPLQVTIDLMFAERADFERAARAPGLSREAVAALYGVDAGTVQVIPFGAALAIKLVIDRPIIAGTPGDSDVYGAQQHAPLLEVVI